MSSFLIEPIYDSAIIALVASVVAFTVLFLVTPPAENPIQRRWLLAFRAFAALILVVAMFRPGMVKTDTAAAEATLVVAVDTSRSMTLPDGDQADRWTHQKQAWQALSSGLAPLADSMNIRLLGYNETATELSNPGPSSLDDLESTGELTDLNAAATSAISIAQGQPLAGVVLMGDGTQTSEVQGTGAQRVAQTLKNWGVPLWTVPIGQTGGSAGNRDVSVDALPESYSLFSGNDFQVNFQVSLRGLAGISVPVEVSWIDGSGNVTTAAKRHVLVETASDVQAVSIPITAPRPGIYRLQVAAETQSGEWVTTNNRQTAFVNVREGGGRILYIEGESLYEQRFLRMALRRFPDLDLTYQWIPSDTASRWPIPLDNSFGVGKYDIYIIGDVDADAIGREQLEKLREAVSAGAGLMMLGGYHTYDAGGYASSPLADVLPIRMDASRRRDISEEIQADAADQIPGPLKIELARSHPITNLGSSDPEQVWDSLPPLLGANRFVGPKVAPGVQVLLETPQKQPLLVVGEFGRGRTAAIAFDSTWRWWREGHSEAHRRFWRQAMLWLLSREENTSEQIVIELESRRFATNAQTKFQASLATLSATETPVRLSAEIVDETDRVIAISDLSERSEPNFRSISGSIPTLEPGYYRLKVSPSEPNSSVQAEQLAFQVIDQSREMATPMADPVYLRQLAKITSEHGGDAFSYEQMDALIERISERRKQAEAPVVEKYTVGDDPLSGWLMFALFATALIIEWTLRRRWGLA
ncbi:hypothetical protein Q31b_20480 [Novipirellula aureliae]|uniref:Putative glutamine amidotransferase domain-containing protein n=1 Tax=Novipirellula aureliae TaxID=2527966 RepID=A0A5C6E000_9BACT|nr:glutamine amidotransferase [Novipirellula aureliae]TWU43013.1 hypothetical protein Q31b_20480 [Novipirellula aureliae]